MTRHRNRARIVHGAALTGAALLALVPSLAPAATAVPASTGALATTSTSTTALPTGLSRLLAGGTPTGRAIATFDTVPTAADVDALESLGLTVQPMEHLKLALVAGPVEAMRAAVTRDVATDVYPDEKVELLDTASTDAMGTAKLRAKGLTGKGVNVAVVDSGCDATHPDLAGRVRHNVALYSAEYANYPSDSFHTLVVPMDQGPASNTDLGSGHGTHVAGIIAADSSSVEDGSRFGVAPDATLECFAIGAVIFTTAVVTAYDYMLDQPNLWDIDVVNNSWGNSFRQFDPRDPVHQATKAVADQGVTVVFAAGNSGSEEVQASQNPWSLAPWVISVAAGTVDHHRGDFSSNGLRVRQLEGHRDRCRRAHHLLGRPDRRRPPGRHRTRRRHLLELRLDRHRDRAVRARRQRHRVRHLDGLAARGGSGRRAEAGPACPHPEAGPARPAGDRHPGARSDGQDTAACRSGRSATATSTSTPPSPWSAARAGATTSPTPPHGPTAG